jgi:hypothetical protein
MIRQTGSRLFAFLRAMILLALAVVGIPVLLVSASRARFGGGAPLHGVASPTDWQFDRVEQALTDRLTDQTIADVVIRSSLIVAWIALGVLVLTVMTEVVHMLRHQGLAMPDIRGFGVPQSIARLIATGLLVVVPGFASPTRAAARDGVQLVPYRQVTPTLEVSDAHAAATSVGPAANPIAGLPRVEPGRYVVRAGDSIHGIAERLAGPDQRAIADFAERLLDLNLDTTMPDGQRFTNAAYIDVGWILELPSTDTGVAPGDGATGTHVVDLGESLWSIADDELGDGRRWPEIFERNEGRTFGDGRRLVDPDLIQPGWNLDVPTPTIDVAADVGTGVTAQVAASAAVDPVPADVPVPTPAAPTPARPDNVWEPTSVPGADGDQTVDSHSEVADDLQPAVGSIVEQIAPPTAGDRPVDPTAVAPETESESLDLLTFTRAAMLSAGVLTLLAVRRRNQLRRGRPRSRLPIPGPRPTATERALRSVDADSRLEQICSVIGSVVDDLVDHGQRVVAVLVGGQGDLEFRFSGPVVLAPPWQGSAEIWRLPGVNALELVACDNGGVACLCPTLVQLGRHVDGRDAYVDLEACGAIEVGGRPDQADAIVAATATTLAASTLAEVTTLVGLAVPDAAFLGHRLHVSTHDDGLAFQAAAEAVGTTASAGSSTFALRASADAGEAWEPAVVLAGSGAGQISLPHVPPGLAVVSAAPIVGPSCRLGPDGDAWALQPLGIRLAPIGLSPHDVASIAELVDVRPPVPLLVLPFQPDADTTSDQPFGESTDPRVDGEASVAGLSGILDPPATIVQPGDLDPWEVVTSVWRPAAAPAWELLVRLLGPVAVISGDGDAAEFQRSKTRELVAWLATHRNRSTRTAARTAMWELDVRDATFSNVVSEARRSLARLVEPPDGEEWVGRTMTEALPLHDLVVTDADLIEQALEAARLQPPAQAIATLTPSVELINGMPFEGTSYLWPDAEGITSNLVLLATSAAAELAAHCLSLGDIDGVFRATGRGLQVLPGQEELIGLRMRAHADAGDHAGVRQEWESYERVITADPWSDGEPASKLVELRRHLLNPSH